MLKYVIVAIYTGVLLLSGCQSGESAAGTPSRELKIFYAEDEWSRTVYREIRRDEVAGEDDFFGDSNQALFRAVRRRAEQYKADAVVIGETHRADCGCADCKSAAKRRGSTTFAKVTFLQKKKAGTD